MTSTGRAKSSKTFRIAARRPSRSSPKKAGAAARSSLRQSRRSVKSDISAVVAKAGKLRAKTAEVPVAIGESAGRAVRSAFEAGSELVTSSTRLGKDAAGVAVDKTQDAAQNALDLVSGAAEAAGEAVEAGKANLARQIKRNPVAATITALGVGFIAGVAGRK